MTFKDSTGYSWEITITVGTIARVRSRLNVDLSRLYDEKGKLYREVILDPVAFVNLIYVLCESQAMAAGIIDEQFGERFNGEVYELAMDAFEEEMIRFFPNRQRETLTKAKAKFKEVGNEMIRIADQRIADMNVTKAAEEMLSASLTSLPG